jgi:hypothetical protein
MRSASMPASLVALLACCAVTVLGGLGLLLAVAKRETPASRDYRVVALGGLQYEAMQARPINPGDAIDAGIVSGLPARARRLRSGQMLLGAFVAVSNDSLRPVPAAARIELRDQFGRDYQPLQLPANNPYAYVPMAVPPKHRVPADGTAAADNLAATGKLLLFRIPAGDYETGALELVIHDARHPAHVAYLNV